MTGVETVERYYYLTDHLGSVRATLNETGDVVHYDDYYPFGAPMPGRNHVEGDEGDPTGKPRYTGHEREWEMDDAVYYAGARYYDAVIVRWNAIDPLMEKHPDWTPYNYVLGNPLRLVDPDGRQVDVIAWHGADLSQVGSGRQVQPGESWIANLVGDVQQRSQELGITDTDAAAFSSPVLGSSHGKALDFLKDNHAEGEKIVLLGFSYGGDEVVDFSEILDDEGFEVDLLITVDAAAGIANVGGILTDRTIPPNVKLNINFYQRKRSPVGSRGNKNRAEARGTGVANFELTNTSH